MLSVLRPLSRPVQSSSALPSPALLSNGEMAALPLLKPDGVVLLSNDALLSLLKDDVQLLLLPKVVLLLKAVVLLMLLMLSMCGEML